MPNNEYPDIIQVGSQDYYTTDFECSIRGADENRVCIKHAGECICFDMSAAEAARFKRELLQKARTVGRPVPLTSQQRQRRAVSGPTSRQRLLQTLNKR